MSKKAQKQILTNSNNNGKKDHYIN